MIPQEYLIVTCPEETERIGCVPSSHIPTFGHVATTFDVYRTVGIDRIDNVPDSWAFTDLESVAALGRIVDGPIISGEDIAKAESALRAALLYEFAEVMVPCVKAEYGNGLISYLRFDDGFRNQASFESFSCAPCRDRLLAIEYVNINNGEIVKSNFGNSQLLGKSTSCIKYNLKYVTERSSEVVAALSIQCGAATHYTDTIYSAITDRSPSGFIDELYRRVYRPWMDVAQAGPQIRVELKLPPLLAIILNRANSRSDVPRVLREIRDEMTPVRSNLINLNRMIDSCVNQSDIYAQSKRITDSFDAIVAESILTRAEFNSRRFVSIFKAINPLRKIYTIAADPLAANHEKFIELAQSINTSVKKDSRIVSRFVASSKIAELLRVGSVRDMVTSHFSKGEQRLIHQQISKN